MMIRYGTLGVLSSCIVASYTGRAADIASTCCTTQRETVSHRLPGHHSIGWAMPSQNKGVVMQNRHEQTADRQYHQPVEPHSGNHGSTVVSVIFGIIVLVLVGVGIVQAHTQVAQAAVILTYVMIGLALVVGPTLVVYPLWHKWHMDKIKRAHARLDAQAKDNQMSSNQRIAEAEADRIRADAERIRAEAEVMRITVKFDDQGNAALRNPLTWQVVQLSGNMREHPALHSVSYHNSINGPKAEEKVTVTPVVTFPEPRNFTDILTRWRPSEQGIFLLNTLQGDITVPIKDVCHVGLGGPTGGGKTNTTRLLIAQMLAAGGTVYLASPNYAPVKLNGNHLEDWRPITAYLKEPPAREPHEIENLLHRFIELLDRRRANEQISPKRGKDVILALGEWPAIVKTVDDAPELLGRLLREARQYGIHVIAEFQDALINTIGGNSGVRENYRTAYYFGGDQKTAKILLDLDNKTKIDETGLGELGAAYLRSKASTACPGRVPWLSNQALYMLLGRPTDPVTDDTILDESEVPEAFQPYVLADSPTRKTYETITPSPKQTHQDSLPHELPEQNIDSWRKMAVTGELVSRVSEPEKPGEAMVSLTKEERAVILAAAHAQLEASGKEKVNRTKLIQSLNEVDKSWNNKAWDKVRQVLDEEGL